MQVSPGGKLTFDLDSKQENIAKTLNPASMKSDRLALEEVGRLLFLSTETTSYRTARTVFRSPLLGINK